MRIYLVITEFDSSQYCEPDIYKDVDAVFDSEEKAKQYINDTLVAELIEMVNGIKKTQQLEFHLLYWGLLLNIL